MDFCFVGEWLNNKQNIVLKMFICVVPTMFAIIGALFMNEIVKSSSFLSKLVFCKNK